MTKHTKELAKIKEACAFFQPEGAFIAGGALTSAFTGTPINDVDIYFKSKEAFIAAVEMAYEERLWCVAATDRAVTFIRGNDVIQLMHFDFFQTAEAIFDAFDFTVCMAAYDLDAKDFAFHEDFFKHASQRFLRFRSGTRYPYGSLMRVLKYQQRGYTIGKSDMLRIGLSASKVQINSWEDLANAIGGQYGDRALIETEVPFSLEAVDEMFSDTEFVFKAGEDMPSNVDALLIKIGMTDE